jgi:hypothetical protein
MNSYWEYVMPVLAIGTSLGVVIALIRLTTSSGPRRFCGCGGEIEQVRVKDAEDISMCLECGKLHENE